MAKVEAVHWAVVPFIGCIQNTKETAQDLLNQSIPTRVLLVDNGSSLAEYQDIRSWAEERIYIWRHNPALPSLSATWNAALDFVWATGGEEAMVCNNDIRLKPWMYEALLGALHDRPEKPLFVSGVNHPEGYEKCETAPTMDDVNKGGPDFSCYVITKEGHEKYRFDENFTPAYMEDLDMHRRYMLGGDGSRIFSVPVPYLHKDNGSGTLKSFSPERAAAFHTAVEAGSRTYYRAKWGGGANTETYRYPFGVEPSQAAFEAPCPKGCVTTPQLQGHGCTGGRRND